MTLAEPEADAPTKASKRPLAIGLLLALLLGGGGFYAVFSGLVLGGHAGDGTAETAELPPTGEPDMTFVEIPAILISLGPNSASRHLRFVAQIETREPLRGEVAQMMPRIQDVLNTYLRAVSPADLEDPAALMRLRAQMTRRVQTVTGEGRVRDLLITEFVMN